MVSLELRIMNLRSKMMILGLRMAGDDVKMALEASSPASDEANHV